MTLKKEIILQGSAVSQGIAIGNVFLLSSIEENIPSFKVSRSGVDQEIARYRRALFSSREDLQRLQSDLLCEGSKDAVTIIDTHIQMLEDPLITIEVEEKIRQTYQNTESVFYSFIVDYEKKFSKKTDPFFKQRLVDIMDLSKRILSHLCPQDQHSGEELSPNTVIVAKELIPTDTASVQTTSVVAFITQSGGGNSHAALIARAKGIPYVSDIDSSHMVQNDLVIVDGFKGMVIINPQEATLKKYEKRKDRYCLQEHLLAKDLHLQVKTLDAQHIEVAANVGHHNDVEILYHDGKIDIGLLRTEYFFLKDQSIFPTEEEQFDLYMQIMKKTKGSTVVFRVFDFGGDKNPPFYQDIYKEQNPLFGCRGIRFLLRHEEYFLTQIRAIIRATAFGKIKILLPMISDLVELRRAKNLIEKAHRELLKTHPSLQNTVEIGCMIELPSAALICDLLLQECDFLSLGTNDLMQYTLGIDRNNSGMSDFQFPAHPSVLRLIKMTVEEGKKQGKIVSVCGEIASHSLFTPLLLGMGIEHFSCPPRYIPIIKRVIAQTSLQESKQLAERILKLKTAEEIYTTLFSN